MFPTKINCSPVWQKKGNSLRFDSVRNIQQQTYKTCRRNIIVRVKTQRLITTGFKQGTEDFQSQHAGFLNNVLTKNTVSQCIIES